MKLSVVIPTLGRHASLRRLLESIAAQVRPADEVFVVTGAADRAELTDLVAAVEGLAPGVARVIQAEASVCIQRNAGIAASSGSFVCLADDDIELPPDYFSRLLTDLQSGRAGAVSGLVVQRDQHGEWRAQYPPASVRALAWRWLFQQGVWGDVATLSAAGFGGWCLRRMQNFYRRRGNTFTWGGWPLVTNFSGAVVRTAVYGLGAAIVRRDWLANAPYDEVLDAHGIGDNYGVAVRFPECCAIHVQTGLQVKHHRETTRRLDDATAHLRRVLALDYFLQRSPRFTMVNRLVLRWSIAGFVLAGLRQQDGRAARDNLRLLRKLCFAKNPYAEGAAAGHKKLEIF